MKKFLSFFLFSDLFIPDASASALVNLSRNLGENKSALASSSFSSLVDSGIGLKQIALAFYSGLFAYGGWYALFLLNAPNFISNINLPLIFLFYS